MTLNIPVSTVPAVKTYLYDQLTAAVTGDGIHTYGVFYGPAGQNQPDDYLSVGNVSDRVVTPFTMVGDGEAGAFTERYTVEVVIDCFHGDEDGPTLEAATLAYISQAETVVRADMTFDSVLIAGKPAGSSVQLVWDDDFKGLHASATVAIDCLAQI